MTKREKIRAGVAKPEPRFEEANPRAVIKLEAKNQNQKAAMQMLESGIPVVLLTGSAGTGKSLLAAWRISKELNSKKIDKVFLCRPAVGVGKSIGLLPGEIEEKMAPYFAQIILHLKKFLGEGPVDAYLEKKTIEMVPAEYLRGRSFENSIVLLEEGQNFTFEEMEMILTRIGQNCQFIVTGDTKQNDLKTKSGIDLIISLVDRMLQTHPEYLDHDDIDALDESFGVVKFTPKDVVRSGLTRALVKVFYHND